MRIVCPNCGEEPQKGQRHSCRSAGPAGPAGPAAVEEAKPAKPSPGSFRSRAPCATAGAMCASIASLASKNPGLWKSKRSLARCGGDDFMAALIFMAAGKESWSKNSKQALLLTMNLVAHEAATALQRCWRGRRCARESSQTLATAEAVSGYVAKAATHHGTFGRRRPRLVEPSAPSPVAASDKTQTATRKSNPRPVQSRAVPLGWPSGGSWVADGCIHGFVYGCIVLYCVVLLEISEDIWGSSSNNPSSTSDAAQ